MNIKFLIACNIINADNMLKLVIVTCPITSLQPLLMLGMLKRAHIYFILSLDCYFHVLCNNYYVISLIITSLFHYFAYVPGLSISYCTDAIILYITCVSNIYVFYVQKEELHSSKIEESPSKYFPPCYDNKKAVVECYKKFPNEPMRCAKEVEAFAKCVDAKRSNIIDSRA